MLFAADIVVPVLLSFYFFYGWQKGFLHALIGPVSFLIFCVIGVIHFDLTGNPVISLFLIAVGTATLSFIAKIILAVGRAGVPKNLRNFAFEGSRVLGSLLSLFWKGGITLAVVAAIPLLPMQTGIFEILKNDVLHSYSYHLTNYYILSNLPAGKDFIATLGTLRDINSREDIIDSKEFQSFFKDPAVQAIIYDVDVMDLIKKKDVIQLVTHPKIKAVFSDDELMQKLTVLGQKIYQGEARPAGSAPFYRYFTQGAARPKN